MALASGLRHFIELIEVAAQLWIVVIRVVDDFVSSPMRYRVIRGKGDQITVIADVSEMFP